MALKTFDPPVAPSPGTGVKRKMKILQAEFGDGYTQPTPDGINHIRKTLSLAWDGLTESQKNKIDSFFEEHGGTKAFYYRPAGSLKALKWTCEDWEEKIDGVWKMSATLIQSFTNEV